MTVDELTSSTPPVVENDEKVSTEEADVDAGNEEAEEAKANDEQNQEPGSEDDAYSKAWDDTDDFDAAFDRISEEPIQENEAEENAEENYAEEEPDGNAEESVTRKEGLVIENPVLKFKGKEVPVNSAEEMIALAQKGLKLEIEMQKIKPKKRLLSLIESAGISDEEIQALVDLKNGKAEAIKYLAKTTGVDVEGMFDPYNDDQTNADNYQPQVKSENPLKEFWDEYVKEKPKEAGLVIEALNDLDETFKAELSNPELFMKFVTSVEIGEFDNVYPVAIRIKASNPNASWVQAYQLAAAQIFQEQSSLKKEEKKEPGSVSSAMSIPKSKKAPSRKPKEKDIVDKIWADDKYAEEIWQKAF